MSYPACLRPHANGVLLAVKVQPRASRNKIGQLQGAELRVRVTAPPVDSAANETLTRLLARVLDLPRSHVLLVRGATSRHKLLHVTGLTCEDVTRRLSRVSPEQHSVI